MSLTKNEIIAALILQTHMRAKDAKACVEDFFNILKDDLRDGHDVKISGFGKFEIKQKNMRKGRNPQTGESISITPRKVLTFKPSHTLKDKINR